MSAYYNEIDPYAAQWLRNLITAGLIAPGDVDERSITDVKAQDLEGYTQCHFFAGIGGWSAALRLAGWADDRPVWTGSCPCQGESSAGKRRAAADPRHLWPAWARLISQRRPSKIFGEQVASAITSGWLDAVFHDLEAAAYACAAAVLPACSVGAPHRRDRVWFVADAEGVALGDAFGTGLPEPEPEIVSGPWRRHEGGAIAQPSGPPAFWDNCEWVCGADGKTRPVKPGIRLLAHGIPARVGKLRAFGNAIERHTAAEFIKATGLI